MSAVHASSEGEVHRQYAVSFSPAGERCLVAGEDGAIRVFNTGSGVLEWERGAGGARAQTEAEATAGACWVALEQPKQVVRA